jgi:hypothetical protein
VVWAILSMRNLWEIYEKFQWTEPRSLLQHSITIAQPIPDASRGSHRSHTLAPYGPCLIRHCTAISGLMKPWKTSHGHARSYKAALWSPEWPHMSMQGPTTPKHQINSKSIIWEVNSMKNGKETHINHFQNNQNRRKSWKMNSCR